MTELDHKTLDLGMVIAGIGFPEDDVEVFLDERPSYAVRGIKDKLIAAEVRGEEALVSELDAELKKLREEARATRLVFTLRGLPEDTRKVCDKEAREEFPVTASLFGGHEPNPEKDDKYEELIWKHSIVKVTDHNGAVGIPTPEWIVELHRAIGRNAGNEINRGIRDLVEGAKAGFEDAVRDPDFLSDASPEG